MRAQAGQSTVELLGLLPLLVGAGLALGQLLAAGQAASLADHAARAAAMAVLQGGDPEEAARAAAPSVPKARLSFRRLGARIRVRIEPRRVVPGLATLLAAESVAYAGAS